MKKIIIKRLIYSDGQGNNLLGAEEYSHTLSDYAILCSIHEIGKTIWVGDSLWALAYGKPAWRITVARFYQYQKRWYELLLDAVRRI